MSVYVDESQHKFGRMVMCHMMADTREELLRMAEAIGVHSRHIQKAGTVHEHFDICKAMRAHAVRLGAIEIDRYRLVAIIKARRTAKEGRDAS